MEKTELEKFLDTTPTDSLNDLTLPKKEEKIEEPEDDAPKNRQERRWKKRAEEERESAIALNERVRSLSEEIERLKGRPTEPSDIPPEWIALYGDTPESKKAWQLNAKLLERAKSEIEESTARRLQEERQKEIERDKQLDSLLDRNLEALEDNYNIDLTSRSAKKTREEFLDFVENLSPRDEHGELIGYANFDTAFQLFQKTHEVKPDTTRQKALGARTIQRSATAEQNLLSEKEATRQYLRSQGLDI